MKCVSAIILDSEDRVLLIQRSERESWSGCWAFPGGGLENGEDATLGIIREVKEEVGLNFLPNRNLMTGTTPRGLQIDYYIGTSSSHEVTLQLSEVSDFKWISQDQLLLQPQLLPSMEREVKKMFSKQLLPLRHTELLKD